MMENAEAPATNAHRNDTERLDLFMFGLFLSTLKSDATAIKPAGRRDFCEDGC